MKHRKSFYPCGVNNKHLLNQPTMITTIIELRFELKNTSDLSQTLLWDNEPSILIPPRLKSPELKKKVPPGTQIPFSTQLMDASGVGRTPPLELEFVVGHDFITVTIIALNGWELQEIPVSIEDGTPGFFVFTHPDRENGVMHHFKIPIDPPIGILIVGTTDPALPPA